MTSKDEVTVVIPTLNEEQAIGKVIDEVRMAGFNRIIVVDGRSNDDTVEIARSKGVEVLLQESTGKTDAVRKGIAATTTEYVVLIDGDGSYDPCDVERMLQLAPHYDEVVGRRRFEQIPISRRLGNRLVSLLVSYFLRIPLSDVCSGLYLLRTSKARELSLNMNGFSTEVEIVFGMAKNGGISQVPIEYRERIGDSKLSLWRHGPLILLSILTLASQSNGRKFLNGRFAEP